MTEEDFRKMREVTNSNTYRDLYMQKWEPPGVVECPHLPIREALSEERIGNLLMLADYLETLPTNYAQFDMSLYMVEEGENVNHARYTKCGTVACALGHGPAAGIQPMWHESWDNYSERAFIPTVKGRYTMRNMESAWSWCFGSSWQSIDNTPRGAAKRIRYLLDKGLPANWMDQMKGEAGLSYIMS